MKRFIYEIYYINEHEHVVEYWEAENFKAAKREIKEAYSGEYYEENCPCIVTMIAEIKYEVSPYEV
mgnify:CR=1 FL=1